ncbi:MAG: phenylalanine--tRNA ligase subunit beta [Patescibacteria group bacterium]|mgnify:FL=1
MKISYNWLQNYFEEELPEIEKISEGIIFHSFEVESIEKAGNDTVFDIKVLPDRAHDCLSHWGIAKEISAIFNLKIKEKKYKIFEPKPTKLEIKIEDNRCLRYMGRVVKNVKVGESPKWLKEKLNAIGQKSINNIIDAANFIMFDLGQPIHCFDLDKLESQKIIIRNSTTGESIDLLGSEKIGNLVKTRSILLKSNDLIIADEKNPLAIAGIKGGTKAEVDSNTKNIVIEVANFNSIAIRKTSKQFNIFTEAVKRYENEISPELCEKTMNAITDLIWELNEVEVEEIIDIYPTKAEQKEVSVSVDYINKHLGTSFLKEEIEGVWKRLNFEFSKSVNEFKIKVPYLRIDISGPHDLVEEVGRILGYEKISPQIPKINFKPKINETFYKILWARNKLLNDGYSEIMTYAFCNTGEVEVLSSASDKKFLRTNLSDGLKESLKLNQLNAPLLEMEQIKIFEIGTVFLKDKEEMHVAYGDKKGVKEMNLENFFHKNSSSEEHGYFSAEKFLVLASSRSQVSSEENSYSRNFKPWSIYPFITRDVAVWVPKGESSEELKKLLKNNATELLVREPYIFDSFTKDGKTSYAFRLIFQSYEKTLTDDEVNIIMTKISHKIRENSRWELR